MPERLRESVQELAQLDESKALYIDKFSLK